MTGLLAACIASGIAVCGLGIATLRLLRVSDPTTLTLGDAGIAGLAALGAAGILVNFITPLNEWVTGCAMLAALACALAERRGLYHMLGRQPRLALCALTILMIGVTLGAVRAPLHPDTGLYHFQVILWQHEEPMAWGLANLERRFGFNSIWHTVAAMLWLPGFGLTSVFGANAVIVTLVVFALMQRIAAPGASASGFSRWFAILCLVALAISAFRGTGSPNTDYPSALLNIYAFYLAIRICELWSLRSDNRIELQSHLVLLIILVALASTLKLSQAPLAFLPLIFLIAMLMDRLPRVTIAPTLMFAGAIGVLWVLRNVALSGCAVYPHPATCLHQLPWAVTHEEVTGLHRIVRSWGRSVVAPPDGVLDNWNWVPGWFGYIYRYKLVWIPQLLCIAGVLLVIARRALSAGTMQHDANNCVQSWKFALLAAVACAGLVFWFVSAPDIRFAYGNLISAPFLVLAWCLQRAGANAARGWTLGLAVAAFMLVHAAYLHRETGISTVTAPWPQLPALSSDEKETYPDQRIYRADRNHDCWYARPCTQHLVPGLEMEKYRHWTIFQIRPQHGR